jgi:hypothetical protein
MRDFIEKHFDKLLLAAIIVYMIHVVVFLAIYVKQPETIAWARELTSGFVGALIGLITGVRVGMKMAEESAKKEGER